MSTLGDAWEAGAPDRIRPLFTVGATLQPTPFDQLLRGREAIAAWFAQRLGDWPEASFAAEVLGVGETYGVAHWRVTAEQRALDGVMVVALDDRGRCTSLRQWSHET